MSLDESTTETETTTTTEAAGGESTTTETESTAADSGSATLLGGEQSTEQQAAEGGEQSEAPAGAPESYGDFTVPEGFELSGDRLTAFQAYAKENGMTQERAQGAVDMYTKLASEDMQRQNAAYTEQQEAWTAEVKSDPDLGGANLATTIASAKQALNGFGVDGVGDLIVEHGLGNHPVMVRYLAAVGKQMGSDKSFPTGTPPKQDKNLSHEEILYPDMKQE